MKTYIAQNGEEVVKFVTPSGVTAYVATSISMEAIEGLCKKVEARIARREAGDRLLVGDDDIFRDLQEG